MFKRILLNTQLNYNLFRRVTIMLTPLALALSFNLRILFNRLIVWAYLCHKSTSLGSIIILFSSFKLWENLLKKWPYTKNLCWIVILVEPMFQLNPSSPIEEVTEKQKVVRSFRFLAITLKYYFFSRFLLYYTFTSSDFVISGKFLWNSN